MKDTIFIEELTPSIAAEILAWPPALSRNCRLTENQVGYAGLEGADGGHQLLTSFMALAK